MTSLVDWFDQQGIDGTELIAGPDGEPAYRSLGHVDRSGPTLVRGRGR